MSYNINDKISAMFPQSNSTSQTSNWFKLVEGDNRIRIVGEPTAVGKHFTDSYKGLCVGKSEGCPACSKDVRPTVRWMCHVVDRKDGQFKIAELSNTVFKQLGALQSDEENQFSGFPMPYDIVVKVKGAGSKEVEYTVMSRKATELTPGETSEISKLKSIDDIKDAMIEKQIKKLNTAPVVEKEEKEEITEKEYPTEEINPEDVAF